MYNRLFLPLTATILILVLLIASAWAYWNDRRTADAWVVEQPEKFISGPSAQKELHVAFTLRNTASKPRRILGVKAC